MFRNKGFLGLGLFLVVALATYFISSEFVSSGDVVSSQEQIVSSNLSKEKAGKEHIREAKLWRYKRLANQNTGIIDRKDVAKARSEVHALKSKGLRAIGLEWFELGPNNVGGRTRALLIDKDNSNKLFAGGVAGGLWVSENAGSSWSRINAIMDTVTVTSITQGANGYIYAGTGEGLIFEFDVEGDGSSGHPGGGIFRSTDGGKSFDVLPNTKPTNYDSDDPWAHVNRLAAHPTDANIIYAATEKGIWITTDKGINWSIVDGINSAFQGMDIDIASDGTVWAVASTLIYRKKSSESTFVKKDDGLPSGNERVEIAVSPSDPNYVYAALVTTTRSPSFGSTVTLVTD